MTKLSEWNPFRAQGSTAWPSLWSEMFERMAPTMGTATLSTKWMPRVDVKETPEAYIFTAEAPGMKADDIHVEVTGDSLTISGEKREEKKEEKDQWHLSERSYGSFSRSFTFPVPVDSEKVEAETKDGILTVKVTKSRDAHPRKISIKSL